MAVLGPGTGLGQAQVLWDDAVGGYRVWPSEGSHATFAPRGWKQRALQARAASLPHASASVLAECLAWVTALSLASSRMTARNGGDGVSVRLEGMGPAAPFFHDGSYGQCPGLIGRGRACTRQQGPRVGRRGRGGGPLAHAPGCRCMSRRGPGLRRRGGRRRTSSASWARARWSTSRAAPAWSASTPSWPPTSPATGRASTSARAWCGPRAARERAARPSRPCAAGRAGIARGRPYSWRACHAARLSGCMDTGGRRSCCYRTSCSYTAVVS